jgi:hypothetical protein
MADDVSEFALIAMRTEMDLKNELNSWDDVGMVDPFD